MNRSPYLPLILTIVLSSSAIGAERVTVRFDELPFQSVDGLVHEGVTFQYQVDGVNSGEAWFASYGPGTLDTVSDPSLTGNSEGILTLTFDVPTPTLEFGAALSTADSLSPGFTVELFDDAQQSFMTMASDTMSVGGSVAFSEAQFTHSGTPVSKAVIDFADAPGNFAFDNLVFDVPEPTCASLVLCGLAMLSLYRRQLLR